MEPDGVRFFNFDGRQFWMAVGSLPNNSGRLKTFGDTEAEAREAWKLAYEREWEKYENDSQ